MKSPIEGIVDHYLAEWGSSGWAHAYHDLVELGPAALPYLAERYEQSSKPGLREEIVRIAWKQRTPEALPLLERALDDASSDVWKTALDGLVSLASAAALRVLEAALSTTDGRAAQDDEFRLWVQEALEQTRAACADGEREPDA